MEGRQHGVLEVSFPEVHRDARCSIVFQRTLRVPEGSGKYPSPPGKGRFSLKRVSRYAESVPPGWERGESVFRDGEVGRRSLADRLASPVSGSLMVALTAASSSITRWARAW